MGSGARRCWIPYSVAGALLLLAGCESSRPPAVVISAAPADEVREESGSEVALVAVAGDASPGEAADALPSGPAEVAGEGSDAPEPVDEAAEAGQEAELAPEPAGDDAAAADSKTVLILGDSLAATGLGAVLERRLDAHPGVRCVRKGKSASGLARPDFYDWTAEGARQVAAHEPDLVVVILGGNDGQDLAPKGKGRFIPWHSEAWDAAYKQRMNDFLASLAAPGREVLWLGLPRTNTTKFEAKLELIRAVQRQAVEDHGEGYRYLDTSPLVSDEEGELLRTVAVGRRSEQLRAADGIHFTMAGATFLADRLVPEVLVELELEALGG